MKQYKYLVSHNNGDSVFEHHPMDDLKNKYVIQEFQPNKFVGPWYVVETHYDIKKILKKGVPQNKWYAEVIGPWRPFIKLFFDIETTTRVDRVPLINSIRKIILSTYRQLYPKPLPQLKKSEVLIYSSHSENKTSWHIVLDNKYVKDQRECAYFAKCVIAKNIELDKFIDQSVYSRVRAFRILGTSKNEIPKRPKIPEFKTPKNLCKSLITELVDNAIVLPRVTAPIEQLPAQKEAIDIRERDDQIINKIINHLNPKRADDYHSWTEVGYTIFNIYQGTDIGLQIFDNFSKRSKKYSQTNVQKFWESLHVYADQRSIDLKLKIGTLYYWLRQDNPDIWVKIKNEGICRNLDNTQTRYLEDHIDTFQNIESIKVDYLGQHYTKEKIDELLSKYSNLIIKSPTGSGKTTFTAALVARLIEKENNTILSLVSRQVLSYELMRTFNKEKIFLINYLDIAKKDNYDLTINDFGKLICSIDSFQRVKNPNDYTILYIDEIDSFLEHLFSETLRNRPDKFQRLCDCIQKSKHIICTDADVSDMSLMFLSQLVDMNKTIFIHNKIKKDSFKCLFYTRRTHILSVLIKSIKKGEKNYVCSDSKELIENVYQFVYRYCGSQNIRDSLLLYTSVDGDKKDIIDVDNKWKESNVFTSPTVVYGISFSPSDPKFYFDNVFGIYKNGTINARAQAQQLARPRQIKSGIIHIYSMFNPARRKLPLTYKEIEQQHKKIDDIQERYLRQDSNRLMGKLQERNVVTNLCPAPEDIDNKVLFTRLYFYHCKNKYLSQLDPTFELMKIMREKGNSIVPYYKVRWMNDQREYKIKSGFQQSNRDFKNKMDTAYADISKLTDDIDEQKGENITTRQHNLTVDITQNVERLGYPVELYPKIIKNIILVDYVRNSRYIDRLDVLRVLLLKEKELYLRARYQHEYKEMRQNNLLSKIKLLFEIERYLDIKRFTDVKPNVTNPDLKKSDDIIIRKTKFCTRVNAIYPGTCPEHLNKITLFKLYFSILKKLTSHRALPDHRYFKIWDFDKQVDGQRYRKTRIEFNRHRLGVETELILRINPSLIQDFDNSFLKQFETQTSKFGYLKPPVQKTLKVYFSYLLIKYK